MNNYSSVKGADIVNLFTETEYLDLYNPAFQKSVKIADLKGGDRIVKRISRIEGGFNHAGVGLHFLRILDKLIGKLSPETVDRFESVSPALAKPLRAS